MNRKIHTVISEHLYRRFRNVRTVQPEFAATLIQHINQLNFLLTSVEKKDHVHPKKKIGFYRE